MDLPTLLVSILAVLLVGSYFAGGLLNRRRGEALILSLREALGAAAGARLTWLSRNAFRLELPEPLPGVNRLAATVLLAPREALIIWGTWALQGRGDLLDLKADLTAPPHGAGVVFDPRHRLGREAWQAAAAAGTPVSEAASGGLRVAAFDEDGLSLMERLLPLASKAGKIVLLEVKATQPRLTLLVSIRGTPRASTADLAATVSGLVEAAGA